MWKRSGGICYLILGKYYGITKPKDGYIETNTKNEFVVFIWPNNTSHDLLYDGEEGDKIVNKDKTRFRIINYKDDKKKNDSLYTEAYGYYGRYKKGVIFLGIDI